MIRQCTLPLSHPNYNTINQPTPPKPKPNEMHTTRLKRIFNIKEKTTETISTRWQCPNATVWHKTHIAKTREDSIAAEAQSTTRLRVYTDRSGYKGGIGVAVILYKGNAPTPASCLQYYLKPVTQHSMYEAEAVGLLLAAKLIANAKNNDKDEGNVEIYTDCTSVITPLQEERIKPGQYLFNAFRRAT